jgi:uncharacterized protein YhhL (DUF1145 family)
MTDERRPRLGPGASFLFAAIWLALLIWTLVSPGPAPLHWVQVIAYAVLVVIYVVLGVRRLRTTSAGERSR